jgi:hypothetical protein
VGILPVLGLKNVTAVFDTGTTMIVGDPVGIQDFFSPLVSLSGARPITDSPGYYTSTWANLCVDQASQQYFNLI